MAYTIQSGDTLSEIAEKNNTSVAEIMASNPQISDANNIQAGASLNIASKGSGASTYSGNFGTSSGGSSQEQARKVVGDTRAEELAKVQPRTTPGQAAQDARKYGYVGGIESLNTDQLTAMSQSQYDPMNTKDMVIGGLLGAVIPGAGLLYGASQYLGAAQDRKVAEQLLQQENYQTKGLFGTDLFKGADAAQYVPVYDENDQLVGSLGLDASGSPLRYSGDRMADYQGLGSDLIKPTPVPEPSRDRDDSPSPVSAEAVGVDPAATTPAAPTAPGKVPFVRLPSALDQPMARPTGQALTQPTQLPPNFGQPRPAQRGIMGTQAAMKDQQMYPFMYGTPYQRRPQNMMS